MAKGVFRNMKIIHKCYVELISILKISYAKIKMSWINSIKGSFRIEIIGSGKIKIGRFLMTRGSFYLKSVNNGVIEIGERVFFKS